MTKGTGQIKRITVSPALAIKEPLTYAHTGAEELKPGQTVIVTIRNRITPGWVTGTDSTYTGPASQIIGYVTGGYLPDQKFFEYIRQIAEFYFVSQGQLFDLSLPPNRKPLSNLHFYTGSKEPGGRGRVERLGKYLRGRGGELQRLAANAPLEFYYKNDAPPDEGTGEIVIGEPGYQREFLLSYDRLEQYRKTIDRYKDEGRSVLITAPDNLTARYLHENLSGSDLYTSETKARDRNTLWQEYAMQGKVGVVIGGLSAVLMPIKNLGAVICDRASSHIYKNSYFSKFDVSRLARIRAEIFQVKLVEGAPSFTMEAYVALHNNELASSEKRKSKELPYIEVRMINHRKKGIAPQLLEMIKSNFLENKKTLVILNKREGDDFLFCPKCQKLQQCPGCKATLKITPQKGPGLFFPVYCPRCGFKRDIMDVCSKCNSPLNKIEDTSIASLKRSICREIVETGVVTLFDGAAKAADQLDEIKSTDIVLSTPTVINPYFKGIFDAVIYIEPASIFSQKYHAAEATFALVAELRELVKEKGSIDIYSTFHFHYALKLVNHEIIFFERELKYREWFNLPPHAHVYNIEVMAGSLRELGKEMRMIFIRLRKNLGIMRVYLFSRQRIKGAYRGIIEAHTLPRVLWDTELHKMKQISIEPILEV